MQLVRGGAACVEAAALLGRQRSHQLLERKEEAIHELVLILGGRQRPIKLAVVERLTLPVKNLSTMDGAV